LFRDQAQLSTKSTIKQRTPFGCGFRILGSQPADSGAFVLLMEDHPFEPIGKPAKLGWVASGLQAFQELQDSGIGRFRLFH
jgi:hypothetical protein